MVDSSLSDLNFKSCSNSYMVSTYEIAQLFDCDPDEESVVSAVFDYILATEGESDIKIMERWLALTPERIRREEFIPREYPEIPDQALLEIVEWTRKKNHVGVARLFTSSHLWNTRNEIIGGRLELFNDPVYVRTVLDEIDPSLWEEGTEVSNIVMEAKRDPAEYMQYVDAYMRLLDSLSEYYTDGIWNLVRTFRQFGIHDLDEALLTVGSLSSDQLESSIRRYLELTCGSTNQVLRDLGYPLDDHPFYWEIFWAVRNSEPALSTEETKIKTIHDVIQTSRYPRIQQTLERGCPLLVLDDERRDGHSSHPSTWYVFTGDEHGLGIRISCRSPENPDAAYSKYLFHEAGHAEHILQLWEEVQKGRISWIDLKKALVFQLEVFSRLMEGGEVLPSAKDPYGAVIYGVRQPALQLYILELMREIFDLSRKKEVLENHDYVYIEEFAKDSYMGNFKNLTGIEMDSRRALSEVNIPFIGNPGSYPLADLIIINMIRYLEQKYGPDYLDNPHAIREIHEAMRVSPRCRKFEDYQGEGLFI